LDEIEKPVKMKILYQLSIIILTVLISSCVSETETKYVFDLNEFTENRSAYTISTGPMDELDCELNSLIFYKETLDLLKIGKKPNIGDVLNIENFSPTTIKLYKNQIEWVDLGQTTLIKNDITSITGIGGATMSFDVFWEGERLSLGFKDKDLECTMPFMKILSD
jgi:hypothetical protein